MAKCKFCDREISRAHVTEEWHDDDGDLTCPANAPNSHEPHTRQYRIKDSMPCWVTWSYIVTAADETDALDRYYDGEYGDASAPEIGDSIDYAGNGDIDVEEV